MSSSKDFLEFVLDQLSALPDITYRPMMGEFIIYYRGKIIGGIYDNQLLVKLSDSVFKIAPNATMKIPYKGGKPMIMVPDPEDQETLKQIFDTLYDELPNAKK